MKMIASREQEVVNAKNYARQLEKEPRRRQAEATERIRRMGRRKGRGLIEVEMELANDNEDYNRREKRKVPL